MKHELVGPPFPSTKSNRAGPWGVWPVIQTSGRTDSFCSTLCRRSSTTRTCTAPVCTSCACTLLKHKEKEFQTVQMCNAMEPL